MWLSFFSISKSSITLIWLLLTRNWFSISCISPAGQVVLDVPLHFKSPGNCRISCIKPLAVPSSASAQFIVKGFNLFRSSTR